MKELEKVRKSDLASTYELNVDETQFLHWEFILKPTNPPYNHGAFKLVIEFPVDYPFKPPKLKFLTKIYHPNIDETGRICLPIITPENWKPAISTEQILQDLFSIINEPQVDHPLRADIAEEYVKDQPKFLKKAEEFTKQHALSRS
ncbi:ubiquitin-conjugating enzyme [Cichlidogyrus casuarinus]|uniref:E2 ubiquitin-conjugating enzyme n=1 Tax=Cichlidogyrus casuarinus TaxID=1844966 RepID=A0ABD2Q8X4_9PLAT